MMLPLLPLLAGLASIGPALQFDPGADPSRIVSGQGSPATWNLFGNAALTGDALETSTGGTRILNYVPAKGSFSVETVFRIDAYGAAEWNWLSDLVNTATWAIRDTIRPEQGFTLRIGGGYWYPELGAGAAVSEWSRRLSLDYAAVHTSAKMSRCLLDFNMGPTNQSVWFEIFSDRCVEPGGWHHAVATWDGKRQRLFLDGEDVTDPWRVHLPADVPRMDSGVVLNIGARALSSLDFRYLDGGIRLVSLIPKALSDSEITARYRTVNLRPLDSICAPNYRISSPLAFQGITKGDTLRIRKLPGTQCTGAPDTSWNATDSIEIQALDSTLNLLGTLRTSSSRQPLQDFGALAGYDGLLYFRLRPLTALAARIGEGFDWSNILPSLHLAYTTSVAQNKTQPRIRQVGPARYLLTGCRQARISDASGAHTTAGIELHPEGLTIDLSRSTPGLYLATTEAGTSALFRP